MVVGALLFGLLRVVDARTRVGMQAVKAGD